MVMLRSEKLKQ
jgi:hypothetical protein